MERDFEREFRELKQNEIPDLWNRIEAGLSEKKNMTSALEKAVAIDNGYAAQRERSGKRDAEKGTGKKPFAWRKWGTLAAACLCVIIIFPAFSLLIRNKSYSGSGNDTASYTSEAIAEDNAAAMDTAVEESAENGFGAENTAAAAAEAVTEEAVTVTESTEGTNNNAVMADAGDFDSAASANEAAAGASADTAPAAEETLPDRTVESAWENGMSEAEVSRKDEEKAVWDELADGQILEEAVVRIQKAETTGNEAFYQASVELADADNILEAGMQIALVCNADTAYGFLSGPRDGKELKERELYQVMLCYDAESGKFAVLEADEWEE